MPVLRDLALFLKYFNVKPIVCSVVWLFLFLLVPLQECQAVTRFDFNLRNKFA